TLHLSLRTDDGARRPREVRVRDRPERGEGLVAELIDGDRGFDVLQAVLAEVGERALVDELTSRAREQALATLARGCTPGREVHVVSHVALVGDERSSGVQPD